MTDCPALEAELPSHQQTIRANCVHPTGRFAYFEEGAREQSIPARFAQQAAQQCRVLASHRDVPIARFRGVGDDS